MEQSKLQALRARLWAAKVNGHGFAAASEYGKALEADAGAVEHSGPKYSIGHLIALVEKALKKFSDKVKSEIQSETKPETKPIAKPVEKKPAPKTETTSKPKA